MLQRANFLCCLLCFVCFLLVLALSLWGHSVLPRACARRVCKEADQLTGSAQWSGEVPSTDIHRLSPYGGEWLHHSRSPRGSSLPHDAPEIWAPVVAEWSLPRDRSLLSRAYVQGALQGGAKLNRSPFFASGRCSAVLSHATAEVSVQRHCAGGGKWRLYGRTA